MPLRRWLPLVAAAVALLPSCRQGIATVAVSPGETFAEMRAVKGAITVTPPAESARAPYPRERLSDGEVVSVADGGLTWIRGDAGAVFLVAGPARLTLHGGSCELNQGRAFVDTNAGPPVQLDTPHGRVELSDARASAEVKADGTATAYVLRGSARTAGATRAGPGELLSIAKDGAASRAAAVAWDDWTGGLATADPAAEPAPFGIGTVGARPPGDKGKPRFSLVVQRLDVRVTVDHDLAITEVDETFVNPTSTVVEGIFSFRTPPGAVLQRFGVDRNGDLVWGRVKESAAAVAQYESNVYEGSTEDPALLQWSAPGTYSARLYPIREGAQRRVVTRYAEWLPRQGPHGDRRLYVYPMAAEGARGSLPRIEELTVTLDLSRAEAQRVRAGMGGQSDGRNVVIKAFDVLPLADLSVELFDGGETDPVAYRAHHALTADDAPEQSDPGFAAKVSREEADYLLVPIRSGGVAEPPPGIDLAVVVDTSAATEAGALAVSRSLATALLAQLGPEDRAALWTGDAALHPVADGSGALTTLDAAKRRAWLEGLAAAERGGATDIGGLLTEAAAKLDPARRGAVVYVGDGQPSVGEIAPKALRERLAHLPQGTRVFCAALGSNANVALLQSVARGAPVEPVTDAYGAARAALRLLEAAYRPSWVGATADLGPGVERVLPRELPTVGPEQAAFVVGRLAGQAPAEITLRFGGQEVKQPLRVVTLADSGDLRRRWGEQRLGELLEEGAGRAAVVDVARRFGLVSPFTSLYVPTTREMATTEATVADVTRESRRDRWKPWWHAPRLDVAEVANVDDVREGGTGTRAKGEEGVMGKPTARGPTGRYGVQGAPSAAATATTFAMDLPKADEDRKRALQEASQFGMIGTLAGGAASASGNAPSAPWGAEATPQPPPPRANAYGDTIADPNGDVVGTGGLGLSGIGGGGGRGNGIGLGGVKGGDKDVGGQPRPAKPAHAGASPPSTRFANPARAADTSLPNDPLRAELGNEKAKAPQAGQDKKTAPSAPSQPQSPSSPPQLGFIGHAPRPCGAAADLSVDERIVLWRERLSVTVTANAVLDVYRNALAACEAPGWRERHTLLLEMVSRLPTVRERVALWRAILYDATAADMVYRAIVVRVQSPAELRELHDALGLRSVDPDLLAGILRRAKTPADRLALLHGTALKFPDDLELALRVLDSYEDVGDDAGGRAWARRLRRGAEATAHVYTNVGEYYLRLSHKESGPASTRDADEARRTFGELVEFAPEDPIARRRLGDLLRAHAWYEEAFRQYETLAQLTPDDPAVPMLLAAAAQGMGRTEEAVSWAEKAASAGSPDGSSPLERAARATASAFLAWARDDAAKAGRTEEADRLRARAKRLVGGDAAQAGSVRFLVTWSHPELHPALWTNALGAPMPAPDTFPLMGVAQAVVPGAPPPTIELRLDPEDAARAARLGAQATVTAIVAEGTPDERIARLDVGFGDARSATPRVVVTLDGGALKAVAP